MNQAMRNLLVELGDMSEPVYLVRNELGIARQLEKSGYISLIRGGWASLTAKGEEWYVDNAS